MKQNLAKLKTLRKENNLSQKQLAQALGTTNSSICDWECGRTEPDIEMLIKISKFFGISVDYLLGLKD
ncbi:MAG: helix-turn-helix domain-containing protein [Clostridia bacterium]|nr:helix-turn-helix domain-containing protein [Clostridia bacterium]